jgi:homoserine kinase
MPRFLDRPVTVRVPATSANLGPGFDAFGLALAIYDEVTVAVCEHGLRVDVVGEGESRLPTDARNLVVESLLATLDHLGGRPSGLVVSCRNTIPQGRGLGSSAAAIVAGMTAATALTAGDRGELDTAAALRLAAGIEGHADNLAAAMVGGVTLAWAGEDGPRLVRLHAADGLAAQLLLPPDEVSTPTARAMLPSKVPRTDAVANSARAALLVVALTQRPDLLSVATHDWLHQAYRAPAMPASYALVQRLRRTGSAAVISGAGPAVLVLSHHGTGPILPPVELPAGWAAVTPPVDRSGTSVRIEGGGNAKPAWVV